MKYAIGVFLLLTGVAAGLRLADPRSADQIQREIDQSVPSQVGPNATQHRPDLPIPSAEPFLKEWEGDGDIKVVVTKH